jgi:hypothetical protein
MDESQLAQGNFSLHLKFKLFCRWASDQIPGLSTEYKRSSVVWSSCRIGQTEFCDFESGYMSPVMALADHLDVMNATLRNCLIQNRIDDYITSEFHSPPADASRRVSRGEGGFHKFMSEIRIL